MYITQFIVASALFSTTFALPVAWPADQLLSVRQNSGTLVQREDVELFSRVNGRTSKTNSGTPASTSSSVRTPSSVSTTSSLTPSSDGRQSRGGTTPRQSGSGNLPGTPETPGSFRNYEIVRSPPHPTSSQQQGAPRQGGSQTRTPDSINMNLHNLQPDTVSRGSSRPSTQSTPASSSQRTPRQSDTRFSQDSTTPRQGQSGTPQTFQPSGGSGRTPRTTSSQNSYQQPPIGYINTQAGAPRNNLQSSNPGRSQGPSFNPTRNPGSSRPQNPNPLGGLWRDSPQSSGQRPSERPVGVVPGHNARDVEHEERQADYNLWKAKVAKQNQANRGR